MLENKQGKKKEGKKKLSLVYNAHHQTKFSKTAPHTANVPDSGLSDAK
jgi:hypothetical protein